MQGVRFFKMLLISYRNQLFIVFFPCLFDFLKIDDNVDKVYQQNRTDCGRYYYQPLIQIKTLGFEYILKYWNVNDTNLENHRNYKRKIKEFVCKKIFSEYSFVINPVIICMQQLS